MHIESQKSRDSLQSHQEILSLSYGCQNNDFASDRKKIAKSKIIKSQPKLKDPTKMT